jgi:hypothetical protein
VEDTKRAREHKKGTAKGSEKIARQNDAKGLGKTRHQEKSKRGAQEEGKRRARGGQEEGKRRARGGQEESKRRATMGERRAGARMHQLATRRGKKLGEKVGPKKKNRDGCVWVCVSRGHQDSNLLALRSKRPQHNQCPQSAHRRLLQETHRE